MSRETHRLSYLPQSLVHVSGLAFALVLCQLAARAEDEVKIWEFSPYEVEVWYSFEPDVSISAAARQQFLEELESELDRTFAAAWRTQIAELAPEWAGLARRDFDNFTMADLTTTELKVVVSLKHEETKTVRTLEAAIEQLPEIAVTASDFQQLKSSAARFEIPSDSLAGKLLSKLKVQEGLSLEELKSKLASAELACAVLPRNEIADVADEVRTLLTTVPWHTDSILRQKDKIIFVMISSDGDHFQIQARELDCPMQYLGPTFTSQTLQWPHASRLAAHNIVRAFAPVARVEEAEATTAELRHRAGGLIVRDDNPAKIRVGDVLQPIVRRDDKNGVPTLLQPLSWTFAAITKSDGVRMDANVYSYSGGPGLQGRRNRRTQRVLLRVRPTVEATDIEILVRSSGKPQSGCFVFQRDLLTDEFEELGRTDWRGRFRVPVPENGKFLEASIKRARQIAKREAQVEAAKAEEEASSTPDNSAEIDAEPNSEAVEGEAKPESTVAEYAPAQDPEAIPLNYPLIQIYIKNGNTVLAKLPMVPGLRPLETAELPDDSRRLQTEAFVNGFASEIVSVIGLRNILAARIRMNLKDKELKEAAENLAKMREVPSYTQLADELDRIQRDMLDEKRGTITPSEKRRIDRMFQTTSDLLQKYLQDSLFQQSLQAVEDAGGTTVGETKEETGEG